MLRLVLVFLGGGCGSLLRYAISIFSASWNSATHFPIGTLICNIAGCLLIGFFNAMAGRMGMNADMRLMLTVGLCGGFTTFSTFSNEGLSLLQQGAYTTYALYTFLSIVLGLLFVFIGLQLGQVETL